MCAGDAESLRRRLQHVRWIGGASGAGKSATARALAGKHGMRVYATDDVMPGHADRMRPGEAPCLSAFAAMTMDERWVTRTPQDMLDTFPWFRGEGFGLIVADLLRMPGDQPVVAEGFRLLPELVRPLLARPRQAVWLLPAPEYRRGAFESRGWPARGFLARTSDPQRALGNLLERDRMFTDRLREQARRLGLAGMTVSPAASDEYLARRAAAMLGLDD
jgi:hypothetical protein